jgi:hypothetical protein
MFRISPSRKDITTATATTETTTATNPVTIWTTQRQFRFPPALSIYENAQSSLIDNTRHRVIHDVPRPNTSLYHLISQYNPWLDCEMTREKRYYLNPRVGEMCYPVYVGDSSTAFFRNETVMDIANLYVWPLLHSRADDVIACGTFAEWQRLFEDTISLAFPDYEYWVSVASSTNSVLNTFIPISDQRRTARILKYITPARVLYLLTTRANFWPYGAPDYRSTQQYGICSVKPKIKEYNDKTKIEWLVSADFLRKMKRVHIYFTSAISTTLASSVYDTDEE